MAPGVSTLTYLLTLQCSQQVVEVHTVNNCPVRTSEDNDKPVTHIIYHTVLVAICK